MTIKIEQIKQDNARLRNIQRRINEVWSSTKDSVRSLIYFDALCQSNNKLLMFWGQDAILAPNTKDMTHKAS